MLCCVEYIAPTHLPSPISHLFVSFAFIHLIRSKFLYSLLSIFLSLATIFSRFSTKAEILVEFRPKMTEIQKKAAFDNYNMLLDHDYLEQLSKTGIPSHGQWLCFELSTSNTVPIGFACSSNNLSPPLISLGIQPFELGHNSHMTPYRPFDYIYGKVCTIVRYSWILHFKK